MATIVDESRQYNEAKLWQIGLFTLNNAASNLYLFIIGFVSYYATGIAGLSVVLASLVISGSRIFDAITDPIIGFIIDKTETKFGRFRPMMLIGNILMASSVLIMYNVTHLLPDGMRFLFFIVVYIVYIIGYTFQNSSTRAAQAVLTNHPKQRPLFSIFDTIFNIGIFTGGQVFVASYLVTKHGDFNMPLFTELNGYAIALSLIFTICAIIGIAGKDRKENYGLAEQAEKVRFRDFWTIIKKNKPLQMLVLSASTDKIAAMVHRQPAVYIMFFGIMLGDYALSGTVSMITIIPGVIITFLGIRLATKTGLKNAFVKATWLGLISATLLISLFLLIDPSVISLENMGIATVIFLVLYCLIQGVSSFTPSVVLPMCADITDYESYRSGKFVSGMIGTTFSFVDKLMSALAPGIVGLVVATIGYQDEFPQLGETLTTPLFIATLIVMFGIPMLGWIISLIAMHFYELDGKRMEEIQKGIADIKRNAERNKAADNKKYV